MNQPLLIAGRRCCGAGVIALFAAMSLCRPAAAQGVAPVEIFGGYAAVHDAVNDISLPAGWFAGGAVRVTDWLSAIADVGGNYKTIDAFGSEVHLSAHAAMFGGRASARIGRLTEFVELLAGVVRGSGSAFGFTSTTTAFTLQPGAGVDYPVSARFAARAQLDVRFIRNQPNGNEAGYEYRFAGAIVYRLR